MCCVSESSADEAMQRLRELHATADGAIVAVLDVVAEAAAVAEGLIPPMQDAFEYAEATRALRAALTAVRSALIDLQHREEWIGDPSGTH